MEAKLESGVDYTASALKGVGATIEGLFDDAVGTVKSFWESPFGTVYDIGYAFTVGRAVDALLGARFAWDYAWGTGTARSDAEQLLEQMKRTEEEKGRGYYTGYVASQATSYLTIGKLLKHDEPGGSGGSGGKGKTEGTGDASDIYKHQQYKHSLLIEDVLSNSDVIIKGEDLWDKKARRILTNDGSEIEDWAKMTSKQQYETPYGKGEIHFYQNQKTGEISPFDIKLKVSKPKKLRENENDLFWINELDVDFNVKGVR
ncbi:hypothetical protein [Paenibacillus sp. Marseille-Q7038]